MSGGDQRKSAGEAMGLEVILKVTGALAAVFFTRLRVVEPGARQTDRQASAHSQDVRRAPTAHAAAVFIEDLVEAVMQLGLDPPITAFGGEQTQGVESFVAGTGNQVTSFVAAAGAAAHARAELANLCRAGEADFLRGYADGLQCAHFAPTAIVFTPVRLRGRRRRWGKKAPVGAWWRAFGRGLFGWP